MSSRSCSLVSERCNSTYRYSEGHQQQRSDHQRDEHRLECRVVRSGLTDRDDADQYVGVLTDRPTPDHRDDRER
jgi:hypothetical protein